MRGPVSASIQLFPLLKGEENESIENGVFVDVARLGNRGNGKCGSTYRLLPIGRLLRVLQRLQVE